MRVLVVTQYFWPETFRVNDIVAALTRRGHEVTVLTGRPNYPDGVILPAFRAAPQSFARFEGADVVRVPLVPRGRNALQLLVNYASFVVSGCLLGPWRLRGRAFDAIFIFQASPVTSAIPGLLLSRLRGIPAVMWVLDLWPDTLSALGVVRSPAILALVGRLVGAIYRGCDLVLGQSRAFEENIRWWSGDATRYRYLPGWAEPMFEGDLAAVPIADEVRAFMDGTFNVMFAGNLGESQDFPSVLAAAERLRDRRDIRWLIVGDGRVASWMRDEIARRGLGGCVHLLGRHPIERMPAFFRAADAMLVNLKAEPAFAMTIPGKLQAYLAAGVPILGMLDGEGARVIEQSGAGFVCRAGDAAGLADAVSRMAALPPAERAAMGARGRAFAAAEFDRERLIDRLVAWLAPSETSAARG
ncbi:MAG: glycosyltransferase family 4 protein [Gemmatimonadetes bacterium]|nr:glycosyltransferase family 4 protein [Gemmatimonadota bacterium]